MIEEFIANDKGLESKPILTKEYLEELIHYYIQQS